MPRRPPGASSSTSQALEAFYKEGDSQQEPTAELAPWPRVDRPGLSRRPRRPRLGGDGRLAICRQCDHQPSVAGYHDRLGLASRADASRAHHYRIHLWDGVKPIRAEKSAALFGPAAPGIAHAWHMPGHTYTGLKRYADAAYQQEASARVDHAYMLRDRVMPFEIHNYAHNNQWLCTSLSHIGRARDAIAVARNLVEQPRDPQKNGPNDGGSPQRSGRLRWVEVLTRYELWDDLIEATTSNALDWSNIPMEQKEKAYSLGQAYAAKNDAKKLAEQIEALKKLTVSSAKTALAELEGYQLLARGEIGPAFDQFAKATSMRPEALARAHLAARNYGFAESTAKKGVDQNPNLVAPLAALVEILQAVGKEKEARDAYRKLVPIARLADRDLPVFRRLEPAIARWKADKNWSAPPPEPANGHGSDETAINRIDLTTLGPLGWIPSPSLPFSAPDTSGKPGPSPATRGRTSWSSSSWAANAPTACNSSRSSARNTRPSRS